MLTSPEWKLRSIFATEMALNFGKYLVVTRKVCNFAVEKSARGVIGSRARLRIWCLTTWGFESLRAHFYRLHTSQTGTTLSVVPVSLSARAR